MRIEDDATYSEIKEEFNDFFDAQEEDETAEDITEWITYDRGWWFQGTSKDLRMLAIGAIEIERGILEERVLVEISAIIPAFEKGHYDKDILDDEDEREDIEKDIEYIKKNVQLIPIEKIKKVIFDEDGNEIGTEPIKL